MCKETLARPQREEKASPRKPREVTRSRSSKVLSFEVYPRRPAHKLSKRKFHGMLDGDLPIACKSSAWMPEPASITCKLSKQWFLHLTSTEGDPASRAFSTSSLSTEDKEVITWAELRACTELRSISGVPSLSDELRS